MSKHQTLSRLGAGARMLGIAGLLLAALVRPGQAGVREEAREPGNAGQELNREPLQSEKVDVVGPSSARASSEPHWVPFEIIDQGALPIVRARLNGVDGQRIVIDVGFKDFILDTLLVDGSGLKLATQGEVTTIDFYGEEEKVPVAYTQELALGDATFKMVRTYLVEGEDGTGSGGLRSYGRIGRDLFEPLRLTVHYPRRLLLFEESPPNEVPPGGVTWQAVGRHLLIPVHLGKGDIVQDVALVLDAGTSSSIIDRDWAMEIGFAQKGQSQIQVDTFEAGSFHGEKLSLLLGVMKELPYEGRPVGVIGADVLTTLSVSYDFARDLVWLTPVDGGPS